MTAVHEHPDRLLTAADVADLLNVAESWVRAATRDGRLPHVPIGRWRRYQRDAVLAWVEQQAVGGRL